MSCLEPRCGERGEGAPLRAAQSDDSREGMTRKSAGGETKTVVKEIEFGVINLVDITREDNLRARTNAGQDRLNLVRAQVLRFIDEEKAVLNASPPDKVERLDRDFSLLKEIVHRESPLAAPTTSVTSAASEEHRESVSEGLAPGRELLFEGPREKAELWTKLSERAADEELLIPALLYTLGAACGEREERFSCPRYTEETDELNFWIEEKL